LIIVGTKAESRKQKAKIGEQEAMAKTRKQKVESRKEGSISAFSFGSIDHRWDKNRKQKVESRNRRTAGHFSLSLWSD
jgi:hypothetical protein